MNTSPLKIFSYSLLALSVSQGVFYLSRYFPQVREVVFIVLVVLLVGGLIASRLVKAREKFDLIFLAVLVAIALGMTAWLN